MSARRKSNRLWGACGTVKSTKLKFEGTIAFHDGGDVGVGGDYEDPECWNSLEENASQ